MAYLHCHSCSWSQDDFYDKHYNPLTKFKTDFKVWSKPRMIQFDPESGYSKNSFSWKVLVCEIYRHTRSALRMKWWTWKAYKKDYKQGKALCPECKSRDLDID